MRIRRGWFIWMILIWICLIINSPLLAMDDRESRSTLEGLQAVYVQVENLDPELKKELKKGGLTEETLQIRIERRLEMAGIKFLSEEEFRSTDFMGILNVNVRILTPDIMKKYTYTIDGERVPKGGSTDKYLYTIGVELRQQVSLLRNPIVKGLATTWSNSSLGFRRLSGIQMDVADQVDTFANAYQSVKSK